MLTPVVGYLLSSVVFSDPLTPGILASLALIVLGLSLTMRRG
jgi:predicted Kef-type K+ transport protein